MSHRNKDNLSIGDTSMTIKERAKPAKKNGNQNNKYEDRNITQTTLIYGDGI